MKQAFRILQVTDTHLLADPDETYRGWHTDLSLCRVLDHIHEHDGSPDALLLTGDLAQDERPATYRRLRQHAATLTAPLWALPGNHDAPEALQQHLAPELYLGHHDLPGWRVILLNSYLPGQDGGQLGESEMRRLQQCLDETGNTCLIAIHHPPWAVHSAWLDRIGLYNGEQVLELLGRYAQVQAIVCGHIHQAYDGHYRHIRLLGCPSTCRQFLPGSEDFAEDAQAPGYRRLDLRADGVLETGLVRVSAAAEARLPEEGIS